MLTEQDIERIGAIVATKQEVAEIRDDVKAVRELTGQVLTGLDGIAKAIDDLKMEYAAVKLQLDRHDRWIKELAQKVGLPLKD
jgi:hypothetical protein